jgi:hypothetical protein
LATCQRRFLAAEMRSKDACTSGAAEDSQLGQEGEDALWPMFCPLTMY